METILLNFISTLHQAFERQQRVAGVAAGAARLTLSQLHYLEAVAVLGEPTLSEVAQHLALSKASVTAGVNRLVALGYLTKTPSAHDRRASHVRLTPAAHALVAAKNQAVQAYAGFAASALTPDEQHQLAHLLTKLVAQFQIE